MEEELEGAEGPARRDAPRGIHTGRVDDKGRLKLSVDIERFLRGEKLFITSFDGRIARIFPLPIWQKTEKKLFEEVENPEWAADLSLTADKFGGDAEVDAQGRVLMPAVLRRKMEVENQPVFLRHFQGTVMVYSASAFEESDRRADENREEKVRAFRRKGLLV